jgi:hypothetical protein
MNINLKNITLEIDNEMISPNPMNKLDEILRKKPNLNLQNTT